jgi:hypothetical protein
MGSSRHKAVGDVMRMTFVAAGFMSGPIGGRTRTIPAPKV